MKIQITARIEPFDLDGNILALFHGYNFSSTEEVFTAIPKAVGITLTSRQGQVRIVRKNQSEQFLRLARAC